MSAPERALWLLTPRVVPAEVLGILLPFWRTLHGERDGRLALVSGFRIGRKLHGLTRRSFDWPEEGPSAAQWVARESAYGRDVYQRAHLMTEGTTRATSLFIDLNCTALDCMPEPTVVVESSPGRRQCYWRLAEPLPERERKELNRRLSAACKVPWDEGLLLRLPGTLNFKYHDARVVLLHRSEASYSAAELKRVLPELPSVASTGARPLLGLGGIRSAAQATVSIRVRAGLAAAAASIAVMGGLGVRSVREGTVVAPGGPVASAIGAGARSLNPALEGTQSSDDAVAGIQLGVDLRRTLAGNRAADPLQARPGPAQGGGGETDGGGGSNPDAVSSTMSDAGHWVRTSYERAVHGIQGMA